MTPKQSYRSQIFLFSLTVLVLGYILRYSFLPLRKETKQYLGYPSDSLLNFTELAGKYGYLSEQHKVVTEDGYILTMFRIFKAANCHGKKRKIPVLLMHGLLQCSDAWLAQGPGSALPYLIADSCHDLWLGNCRGNYHSRSHKTLDPDKDSAFWDFYIEDIGKYDLPAMVDHVLESTGTQKLNYIGYSQGAGTFLVMCSERPGYCDKVNLLIALGPSARLFYTQSPMFRHVTEFMAKFEGVLARFGMLEMFAKGAFTQEFLEFMCQFPAAKDACEKLLMLSDYVDAVHQGSLTNETIRATFAHFPAGTSLHNMARYGHGMNSPRFEKFDFGKEKNLLVYGSETPQEYNLSAVTVPVVCIYGKNDGIADYRDVQWLLSKLPNVLEDVLVDNPLWNHMDLGYSRHSSQVVFPKIKEYLDRFSQE